MKAIRSSVGDELVVAGRRLADAGLIVATEGNLSARISPLRILATPAGREKGALEAADLVEVDIASGEPVRAGQRASSEIRMHLCVYRHRPDVAAVVHAHPLYATAFAAAHRVPSADLLAESAVILGAIALAPYGTPSTEELPRALVPHLADHDVFLLANHGALTLGRSISEAFFRMLLLERLSQIALLAEALGGGRRLTDAERARLAPVRQHYLAVDPSPPLCRGSVPRARRGE